MRDFNAGPFRSAWKRRQRQRRPWTIDDDEMRSIDDLINAFPRQQIVGGIGTDDREELCIGILPLQLRQRVSRERGPTRSNLGITSFKSSHTVDSRTHHGQTIVGRLHLAYRLLLPWNIRHHQDHDIKVKFVTDIDCGDEVAHMGRIEGAAKQPDPSTRARRLQHDLTL